MPFRIERLRTWAYALLAVVAVAAVISHVKRDELDDPTHSSHH